jgi:hypothetical protein
VVISALIGEALRTHTFLDIASNNCYLDESYVFLYQAEIKAMSIPKELMVTGSIFNRAVRKGLNAILLVSSIGFSVVAFAESQIVSFSADTTHYYPSESFEVAIVYESTDRGPATGVGIRVHYDSSQISIDSIAKTLRQGKVGVQIKQDLSDYDNDPSTDRYINAGWADVNGAWPIFIDQPVELLNLMLTTDADFRGTQLNITIASTDVNYVAAGATLRLSSTSGD